MGQKNQKTDRVKEMTLVQKERLERFNHVRADLLKKGFTEKNLTVSCLKANLMVLVTTLPLTVILYVFYFIVNGVDRQSKWSVLSYILVFLCGTVFHELIHGLIWAFSAKRRWQSLKFGVDWTTLTPYCHCQEALSRQKYALGCAMPTLILGFLPYLVGLAFGNLPLTQIGLLFILAGGGDAYILWLIRKERKGIIIDHPYLVGCVVFNIGGEPGIQVENP